MAIGNYGNIRPSDISPDDLDMFYTFTPSRDVVNNDVIRLDPTEILESLNLPEDEQTSGEENILEGIYNIILPSDIFNEIGFYNIFIRGRQYRTNIVDCGVLSALPTVKGIVLDANDLPSNLTSSNSLQGYRIEYINDDGTKRRNLVRYVVTSNRVIPVTENIGNTSQTSVRYRFDDAGSLIFLQLTPSSSSNVKPNVNPFIGSPNQTILLSNTAVNPMSIEVEFVENDVQSIVDLVSGESVRDVDNGILTLFNSDREIIKQYDLFDIKDDVTDVSLFEVRQIRENIDTSQDINDVIDEIDD